jgi:hypothetical protein
LARRPYFPSEGSLAADFIALKNPSLSAGFESANHGSNGKHNNHNRTDKDKLILFLVYFDIYMLLYMFRDYMPTIFGGIHSQS